jgi:nicotine blue oxidoreductase
MGRPKAMLSLHGELLVERAIRTVTDGGCEPVLVVLGSHAEEVLAAADLGTARAAQALDCQAVAVVLVDQPLVSPNALRLLADAWRAGAAAAVATYDGKPRNPVVLDRSIWAEVRAASVGDVGARGWLRSHPDQVVEVPCDGTGDPTDIDTPTDLTALEAL